ncbi:chorismate mutase [Streptomyces albus subsp. chlorinus]|nr:chorismate mutase [Streptomyces albus subsp. chlorinus]
MTTGAAGAAGAARTAPDAPDGGPKTVIAAERARIDALDARIIALVRDRMEVSEAIQRVRIESGGRRVHLAREMEILDHYSRELGGAGRDLAMTLLRLCRGH